MKTSTSVQGLRFSFYILGLNVRPCYLNVAIGEKADPIISPQCSPLLEKTKYLHFDARAPIPLTI
jgi:hypothetical protein